MKKLIALSLLTLTAIAAPEQFQLTWNAQPTWTTNTAVHIVTSPNMVTPLTNWTVIATVTGTNIATFQIEPGVHFFAAFASNMWGISPFSNVYGTEPDVRTTILSLTGRKP